MEGLRRHLASPTPGRGGAAPFWQVLAWRAGSPKTPFDETAGDFLKATAGDLGHVTQRPLAGEHRQPVHRGPDGVLDPGAALPVEHAGVGQFVEYSAELIQRQRVLPYPAVL